ncbi:MAG: sigma-70 family RNA polymerase sigma factor [Bacteroidota bacterium]
MTGLLDDFSLIDRVLQGNAHAYGLLVQRYQSYAYTLAFRVVKESMAAEEIAQDAFVKAFQALNTFQKDSKFGTWLYRIVLNQALAYLRKKRPEYTSEYPMDRPAKQDASRDLLREERRQYLEGALEGLSADDRTVLTLFYFQELSLEEMSEIMGQPANTIKVKVHRARTRLARALEQTMKEEVHSLL